MTVPWLTVSMIAGLLIARRLPSGAAEYRPVIMLGAFMIAAAVAIAAVFLPEIFELPITVLAGVAVGLGCRLIDEKDGGYLVPGDEPEEELNR